jgi:hypothetical protein
MVVVVAAVECTMRWTLDSGHGAVRLKLSHPPYSLVD